METNKENYSHIPGWGSDAEKSKRPAHIMWQKPAEGTGAHWDVPEQQPGWNDFHSIEYKRHTHVFGDTVPPRGISGRLRKAAFRFSEGEFEHWMILLFADRVNMVEGIFDDLRRGHVPRLLKERGWNVDKKFKTKRYKRIRTFSFLALGAAPLLFFLNQRKRVSS